MCSKVLGADYSIWDTMIQPLLFNRVKVSKGEREGGREGVREKERKGKEEDVRLIHPTVYILCACNKGICCPVHWRKIYPCRSRPFF